MIESKKIGAPASTRGGSPLPIDRRLNLIRSSFIPKGIKDFSAHISFKVDSGEPSAPPHAEAGARIFNRRPAQPSSMIESKKLGALTWSRGGSPLLIGRRLNLIGATVKGATAENKWGARLIAGRLAPSSMVGA
ncbi:MAG: hypothetical protein IJU71_06930 [Selenomonadaceae bacterium]|nr:hypothetical protein [Selenomonadaceae bacterium]